MSNYKQAREFYNYIIKNNGYSNMSMIWTIDCIENSLQAYNMDLITSKEDKEKMCNFTLNFWLDCETDIGISKIADIVVEHWEDLKDKDNYSLLYDYID